MKNVITLLGLLVFSIFGSTDIPGDPSMKATIDFSSNARGATWFACDGTVMEKDFDTGKCIITVDHGNHHFEAAKGVFKPQALAEKEIEIPGGYTVRMRFDANKNEFKITGMTPSSALVAKHEKAQKAAEAKKAEAKKANTTKTAQKSAKSDAGEDIEISMKISENGASVSVDGMKMDIEVSGSYSESSTYSSSGNSSSSVKQNDAAMAITPVGVFSNVSGDGDGTAYGYDIHLWKHIDAFIGYITFTNGDVADLNAAPITFMQQANVDDESAIQAKAKLNGGEVLLQLAYDADMVAGNIIWDNGTMEMGAELPRCCEDAAIMRGFESLAAWKSACSEVF